MNRLLMILSVFGLLAFGSCKSKSIELVVDASVNTTAEGTQDNTFGRIEEALEKAKQLKADDPSLQISILIQKGEYHLQSALTITPELNGVKIIGAGPDKVSIKGSVPLNLSWERENENLMVAKVPANLHFDQLIVNGKAQILARYPNYDETAHYWQGFAADALSTERVASWSNPVGAYFHALHGGRWGGFHWMITGINTDGTPILTGGHQNNRGSKPHSEYRMVENVFEELDSPGEWYLNNATNKLYYWPANDVNIHEANIEVAVLKELVQLVGTLEEPVKDIAISGIKFEHTQRTFMEPYEPLLRSDWTIYRGSALFFEGTEDCSVVNCEFVNLGGNVIMASKYNKTLTVKGNHIHDCGASAVSFIGDPSAVRSPSFNYGEYVNLEDMDTLPGPKNELYPRECLVEDNLIHRIGRIEKQSAGVQISMAMHITVSHNSIYEVPRAGINIGDGTWGGHILEYNDVFSTVLETSDHGSFNSWGRDRFWHPNRELMNELTTANPQMPKWDAIETTIIRNNRFRCDHGWDIDLDDGSSNYHIYNNLCLNNGIKLREGFYRVVENNITVNNSIHPHVWFEKSEDEVRYNILMKSYQDVGCLGWGKELDYNLFPNEASMAKAQIYDCDLHSTFGDPLFTNPSKLDFSVAENSPALKVGFKNFAMDAFGVKNPDLRAMAKTPDVPVLKDPNAKDGKESQSVAWLRNNLKNVDTEQEQSAYGLPNTDGVIVLSVWNNSPAVKNGGLKKRDVILEVEGQKVATIVAFLQATKKYQGKGNMQVKVMRNQKEIVFNINLK